MTERRLRGRVADVSPFEIMIVTALTVFLALLWPLSRLVERVKAKSNPVSPTTTEAESKVQEPPHSDHALEVRPTPGVTNTTLLPTEVLATIEKFLPVLARKESQLCYQDDYGNWIFDKWEKEQRYFIDTNLRRFFSVLEYDSPTWSDLEKAIDQAVLEFSAEAPLFSALASPTEFERHCADALETAGWTAQVTKATGDQGADVIAEKKGRRLVLQCKLYADPIGNKAVQEIFAAKAFYSADYAAVVTNSAFTTSARQLASTTGVLLLHHDELQNIDVHLGIDPGNEFTLNHPNHPLIFPDHSHGELTIGTCGLLSEAIRVASTAWMPILESIAKGSGDHETDLTDQLASIDAVSDFLLRVSSGTSIALNEDNELLPDLVALSSADEKLAATRLLIKNLCEDQIKELPKCVPSILIPVEIVVAALERTKQ
jgi:restriction system protein